MVKNKTGSSTQKFYPGSWTLARISHQISLRGTPESALDARKTTEAM